MGITGIIFYIILGLAALIFIFVFVMMFSSKAQGKMISKS